MSKRIVVVRIEIGETGDDGSDMSRTFEMCTQEETITTGGLTLRPEDLQMASHVFGPAIEYARRFNREPKGK